MQYVIKDSLEFKKPILCEEFKLDNSIESFVFTGQEIISASSLSIPATRLQIFDFIRQTFVKQALSKELGLKTANFSYHSKSGQCPDCKGTGVSKTSMDYWSDSVVVCESCNGKRYNESVLQVSIDGLSIADVLSLSFSEFSQWLSGLKNLVLPPKIETILNLCLETGISYICLGQQLNTLSTGELQRLKLVEGLSSIKTTSLILLDEPTGGLHPSDTQKLLQLFSKLLKQGNTIICATHDEMLIEAGSRVVEL